MAFNLDFTGKVVLITGGTKGVGSGIASRFAQAGATIVVCARNASPDLPANWQFVSADLRDGDEAFAMIDAVVERNGSLDVLVNNAGGTPPADTSTASPRLTERVIQLNLMAAIFCSQQANSHMQGQESGGAIVNISSVCAHRPSPSAAAYGAAKAGLNNFSSTAAMEWAPRVRVNTVSVGMVRTELAHLFYGDDEGIAAVGATIPMGRLASPAEIGDVCLYLSSSLASYVTGADIAVHGGGDLPAFLRPQETHAS